MARKSKSERLANRAKWQAFRAMRDTIVRHNQAHPESELFAPNVTLVSKGRMDLGTALTQMKERYNRCRVSQTIIRNDPVKARKAAEHKFRMNDADLYGEKLETTGGTVEESLVRVGSRGKSGKTGVYRPVGKPDSIPKDGGKGLV